MKIIHSHIDWYEGWANYPKLVVGIDRKPVWKYICRNNMYFAQDDFVFNFFYHHQHNQEGYGGRIFDLDMVDGTKASIKGPWSSRAEVMNREGFRACVDSHIHLDSPLILIASALCFVRWTEEVYKLGAYPFVIFDGDTTFPMLVTHDNVYDILFDRPHSFTISTKSDSLSKI